MSELVRLYKYKALLNGKRAMSAEQLMARQEVSRATLKRDLAKLRDQFNIPVRYDRERGGYFIEQELRGHELPGFWLTHEEIASLCALHQLVSQIQPDLLTGKLHHLTSITKRHGMEPEQMAKRIRILHGPKRRLDHGRLDALIQLTVRRTRARITHLNRVHRVRLEREVSPQKLVLYRDNWYLTAWCHLREDLRIFAVDAIESVQPLNDPAIEIDPNRIEELLSSSHGISRGTAKGHVTLRFAAARAHWAIDEVWHPKQSVRVLNDESIELRFPYSDERELIADILRFGPDVQVVSPQPLRAKVQMQLLTAAARYVEASL